MPTKKNAPFVRPSDDFPTNSWEPILGSLEEGILVIDPSHAVRFVNPAAEQLLGLSQAQVFARTYAEVLAPNPWVVEIVRRTLAAGSRSTGGEGELQSRFLRPIPVRLTCSPIVTNEGVSLGLVLVLHDLSQQKEIQKEEQETAHLAQLGVIAAGLAHEIKNPLAGIRGATQLLQRKIQHDQSAFEYTTVMLREIDRLNGLLEQLLQLSPAPTFPLHPLNVHRILNDVLLLERETAPKGVKIVTRFDPSLPGVLGEESQLAQVFRNLVKNGLQALAGIRGGVLSVATRMATDFHIVRPNDPAQFIAGTRHNRGQTKAPANAPPPFPRPTRLLVVTFSDNGPGIAPEHLPHLFTPFFTTKSYGTGLGLAISQRIIVQHGGMIRVESVPGRGTIFSAYLPVAPQ